MSKEFTPLKNLRENLSKKSLIAQNDRETVLGDIEEIKRSLSRMHSKKAMNATATIIEETKMPTTRRLTSLWQARRNKSMIN